MTGSGKASSFAAVLRIASSNGADLRARHLEPLYASRGRVSLPVTEAVAADSMFLPLYASLTESDQARIIDTVLKSVTR